MKHSEKHMKEILGQDIQIPDVVEDRIQDTFQRICPCR